MRKKKLSTKQILIKLFILTTIVGGTILLFLYGNGLGKLLYLYILVTFFIPIIVFYAKAKLLYNSPKEKLVVDNKGNVEKVKVNQFKKGGNYKSKSKSQNKSNDTNNTTKYKASESPNIQLDIYQQVSNTFKNSLKSKLLKRSDIIRFKQELNKLLNTNINHYQGFTFQNDANEIYVKLKNQYLTKDDYECLLYFLNTLLRNNIDSNLKEVK